MSDERTVIFQTWREGRTHVGVQLDGARWTAWCAAGAVWEGRVRGSARSREEAFGRVTCKKCRRHLT